MIAKIAILFAVVAVAYGGVVGPTLLTAPASTVRLAHAPAVLAGPAVIGGPIAYSAPLAVAQHAVVAAPVAYTSGVRISHTYEPVEQHGYKIVY